MLHNFYLATFYNIINVGIEFIYDCKMNSTKILLSSIAQELILLCLTTCCSTWYLLPQNSEPFSQHQNKKFSSNKIKVFCLFTVKSAPRIDRRRSVERQFKWNFFKQFFQTKMLSHLSSTLSLSLSYFKTREHKGGASLCRSGYKKELEIQCQDQCDQIGRFIGLWATF